MYDTVHNLIEKLHNQRQTIIFHFKMSEMSWSVVMLSELTWYMWSDFFLKWREVNYIEVLRDKSSMYIRVILYWYLYLYILYWLYCDYFIWCLSLAVFVLTLFCNMWLCVRVGFVMCGCVCMYGYCNVWVFWQLYECFGNMCTCIY